ncbi:MAG: xanthine dehydrogenase family protein subunit M [Betaproteobacteria bacterium]|nr:xanthine dehydrogenase family protein subunit M [Betaproteobacteria bacterium]
MKAFQFVTARDSRHALALMGAHGSSGRFLAGGTDLLVELKSASGVPELIVDIAGLEELKGIAVNERGLRIGAMVTHSEIMASSIIRELAPALAEAAHTIGAVQTRNLGTLGGNLVTGVPSMDGGPALMALEAQVTVMGAEGCRHLPICEFFRGPRKTALGPAELLQEIVIPARNLGKPTKFLKFGLRKGQALALVNVAASLWVNWDEHVFVEPRIALGAVAPTVMRAKHAESHLEGRAITPEVMTEAGDFAAAEADPISDFRASAGYRRDLIAVLVARALAGAYACAKAEHEGKAR